VKLACSLKEDDSRPFGKEVSTRSILARSAEGFVITTAEVWLGECEA